MNCKNCGARVGEKTKICPNCGAMIDEKEGYVLLTADDNDTEYEDYYSSDSKRPKKKKKGSGLRWFLSILLTLAIVGAGAYYYFEYVYDKPTEAPPLAFDGGVGIINGDEEIVYVTIKDGTNIEYIHGVTLYDEGRHTNDGALRMSDDYQYTKSINDSFRAIFFDLSKLENDADFTLQNSNTVTFSIQLSYSGDDTVYTYNQPVTFDKKITADVSDVIFDHSTDESTTAAAGETTTAATETTTVAAKEDASFIYGSYWYTNPVKDGDEYTIYAYKFTDGGTYTATRYFKEGDKPWQVSAESGSCEIGNNSIIIPDKAEFLMDGGKLFTEDGNELTARKYNSVKNAEDFFGI